MSLQGKSQKIAPLCWEVRCTVKFNYKDRNDKSVTYSKNQTISMKYKSKQSEPVVDIVDLSCGEHDDTIFR
jgi:hypothetical protein